MRTAIPLALLLLAAPSAPGDTGRRPSARLTYDYFESWNAFREGSSVTMSYEYGGQILLIRNSLEAKTADRLTLKTEVEVNGAKGGGSTFDITRPEKTAAGKAVVCGQCNQEHKKPEVKQSRESLKICGRTLSCQRQDFVYYGCDGSEQGRYSLWYTREIPGWIAQMAGNSGGTEYKQVCVEFVAK